jgi:hypothetical protein
VPNKVKQDSFCARVLIYEGSESLEEIMFDDFPANDAGQARKLAVEYGYGYMRACDLTGARAGVRVISVAKVADGAGECLPVVVEVGSKPRNRVTHQPIYKPFACPIVSMCSTRYSIHKMGDALNLVPITTKDKET